MDQSVRHEQTVEMSLGAQILTELRQQGETLRRLCWEMDLMLAAVHDVQQQLGMSTTGKLREAIDQLYADRSAAAAERAAMQERDTIPPGPGLHGG